MQTPEERQRECERLSMLKSKGLATLLEAEELFRLQREIANEEFDKAHPRAIP